MTQGKLFAVKRLNMVGKPHEVEDLTREIELMKDLEHANIVGYIGASVSTCSIYACTLVPYCISLSVLYYTVLCSALPSVRAFILISH
jgi:serine/threonine protein kinase